MVDEGYIGEIIEASTVEFIAESRELHAPPRFGSFVKVPLSSENASEEPPRPAPPAEEDPFEDPFKRKEGRFSSEYRETVEGERTPIGPAIFAVVYHASTTNTDTARRRAYWKEESQLREEQPELSEWLLMTEFKAIVVGYAENGRVRRYLPPQPPKIHCFVYQCAADEIRVLTARMDFLRTLANFRNVPSEEVVAACIREAAEAHGSHAFDFKVAAGKELANLMKEDYERLEAIMRRVGP